MRTAMRALYRGAELDADMRRDGADAAAETDAAEAEDASDTPLAWAVYDRFFEHRARRLMIATSGTSLATPVVAGLLAAIKGRFEPTRLADNFIGGRWSSLARGTSSTARAGAVAAVGRAQASWRVQPGHVRARSVDRGRL